MKSRLTLTVFAAAMMLITVSAGSQSAQRSANDTPGFTELTLELDTHKQRFVQFEPIPIVMRISNKTTKDVVGHNALIFGTPYLNLFMIGEDGRKHRIPPPTSMTVCCGANPLPFEPGDSYSRAHLWIVSLGETFPQEGEYRIQVELSDLNSREKISSNVVKLKIDAPTGLDSEAVEFLKHNADISNFLNGGFPTKQDTLKEFVARYGESVYGDYATFILAGRYLAAQEYDKALEHFTKLADKRDFFYADRVKEHLKVVKDKLGVAQ